MDLNEAVACYYTKVLDETLRATKVELHCGVHWIPKSVSRRIGARIYIEPWFAKNNNITSDIKEDENGSN